MNLKVFLVYFFVNIYDFALAFGC